MRIFIVCPGVGHIRRGFESFAEQLYEALSGYSNNDIKLFQGAGKSIGGRHTLTILRREWRLSNILGWMIRRDSYFLEQVTFSLALIPRLLMDPPQVILFSDGTIGNILWRVRRVFNQRWKLIFSNGGPLIPPYPKCDHIHQVAPLYYSQGKAAGLRASKQTLIPYGFKFSGSFSCLTSNERILRRRALLLPDNGKILISVCALNSSHKRVDYLIDEVAAMGDCAPFLLLVGARDAESEAVLRHASAVLRSDNWSARTVEPDKVCELLEVADLFALASLTEGFCRATVEALSCGLPVLLHDSSVTRYVAGPMGTYLNMSVDGALREELIRLLELKDETEQRLLRHTYVRQRFCWESIGGQYQLMIQSVVDESSQTSDSGEA